ncbi:MAG: hypothetical protein AB8F78_01220 [Saprospiraceae bacterium]
MNSKSLLKAGVCLFAVATLFLGCAKEELDVSYIYLPAFEILPSATSGDITTQITDVRVVLGAESLGFYPLPARIPILGSGSQLVRLEPVVRVAGLASNRIVYPFYEVFEETLNLVPGTIDTITPQLNYRSSVSFAYVEDFEGSDPSFPLNLDDFTETEFVRSTANVRSGSGSGMATVTEDASVLEVATPVLNTNGQTWNRIWLEMDFYRDESAITVAVLPETPETDETRLFRYEQGGNKKNEGESGRWIKLYFELVDNGIREFATEPFRIGFLSALDQTDTSTTADIVIDNIKVVYQN